MASRIGGGIKDTWTDTACKFASRELLRLETGGVASGTVRRKIAFAMNEKTKYIEVGINRRTLSWIFSAAVALGLMATPLRAQVPEIFTYTTNQTAPTTFTASLAVFSNAGTNVESFAWYFNTVNTNHLILGATNYLLNIIDAQPTNAGSYVGRRQRTFMALSPLPPNDA